MAGALVVGAGPAGLIAAERIAASGHSVRVYEEHLRVGDPCHCAGLISVEGLRRIGLEADPRFIQHDIHGGRIYSPNGTCIEIRDRRTRAYAVDRAELDRALAEKAESAGAEISLDARVDSLTASAGGVRGIRTRHGSEEGLVVDAEGAHRRLLAASGLYDGNTRPLIGVNAEVDARVEPGMVELWLGEKVSPGLFAWVIPTGDGARAGLASRGGDAVERLDAFLHRRFGQARRGPPRTGLVLTDEPLSRTSRDGLLIVGDAAGHAKATTGGGVVLGCLCAVEAAEVAAGALGSGDTSAETLSAYDGAWRRKYGAEFTSMLRVRRLLNLLGDETLNRAFAAVKEEGLEAELGSLTEKGDMDLQGSVIRMALSSPRVVSLLLRVAGRVALAELGGLVNV